MAQKRPPAHKAMRPDEDKLSLRTISNDQGVLERNFDPPAVEPSDHKTVTCYNPACPDYRRPRTDGSSCACKKATVVAT
jgi:hypothetical protein